MIDMPITFYILYASHEDGASSWRVFIFYNPSMTIVADDLCTFIYVFMILDYHTDLRKCMWFNQVFCVNKMRCKIY